MISDQWGHVHWDAPMDLRSASVDCCGRTVMGLDGPEVSDPRHARNTPTSSEVWNPGALLPIGHPANSGPGTSPCKARCKVGSLESGRDLRSWRPFRSGCVRIQIGRATCTRRV